MKVTMQKDEVAKVVENYVRGTFDLTPFDEVVVTKESYRDDFEIEVTRKPYQPEKEQE